MKSSTLPQDEIDWNHYWSRADSRKPSFYSVVASLYRRLLIGRQLRHFVKKYFAAAQGPILHAGCGSGQVDRHIEDLIRPVSLDLSPSALAYHKKSSRSVRLCCGDILRLPVRDGSLAGIYNLGVMEHFDQASILTILEEFRRCLRDDGRIMLFWPPEFGLSVRFLDGLHFILRDVLKQKIKLHPEEISRLQSRTQAQVLLSKGGFELVEYYFGPMDFFTQAVIVAKKRLP